MPVELLSSVKWLRIGRRNGDALDRVLRSWIPTPYMQGQRAKRIGVDCVGFVVSSLDELFEVPPTQYPRLQVDAALHNVKSALRVLRHIRPSWHGSDVVRDGTIQPGDLILTRAESGNSPARPAHVMIAGVEPFTAAHAIPGVGVVLGGVQKTRGIVRVYRPRRKSQWA